MQLSSAAHAAQQAAAVVPLTPVIDVSPMTSPPLLTVSSLPDPADWAASVPGVASGDVKAVASPALWTMAVGSGRTGACASARTATIGSSSTAALSIVTTG